MKVEIKDYGIHLIPESEEEKAVTQRFWGGGINLFGCVSGSRKITLGFFDLYDKDVKNVAGVLTELLILSKTSTEDALCALELCKLRVLRADTEKRNPVQCNQTQITIQELQKKCLEYDACGAWNESEFEGKEVYLFILEKLGFSTKAVLDARAKYNKTLHSLDKYKNEQFVDSYGIKGV